MVEIFAYRKMRGLGQKAMGGWGAFSNCNLTTTARSSRIIIMIATTTTTTN